MAWGIFSSSKKRAAEQQARDDALMKQVQEAFVPRAEYDKLTEQLKQIKQEQGHLNRRIRELREVVIMRDELTLMRTEMELVPQRKKRA